MGIAFQASDHQVGAKLFDERHQQLGGIEAARLHCDQRNRDQNAGDNLKPHFCFAGQSQIPPIDNLNVVVAETDRGKGRGGKHSDPNETVAQVSPQKGWNHDGDGYQQAAHGRGSGFFLVRFGPLLANVLSDLKFAETVDDEGANDEAGEQRGQAGKCGTKGQIAENTKGREIVKKLFVQQPIKQSASVLSLVVAVSRGQNRD